ncbi:DUF1249 domain-containing protein [Duganella sp. FT92W]|uniref:DUF1249 domain-containing protein n=1 Tax=Pseudoduganella rivuli TaxID=2666085 RepID=A0A7X2ISU8_9BURK|nr:DUF1249 domain-containing protein [Pseudoduganella rivuli]MRV75475.1 DUF1249 domain-containing protein [Pseudoduganella rivuli]
MDIYQQNYLRLLQLLPDLRDMSGPARLVALGHTDVNVDVIERHPHRLVLRMSHYLQRLHGAAIPDPDMTVEVYLLAETAGVLTYSDCFGSRKVFCPELMAFSPLAKAELNNFLEQWLTKLIAEGRNELKCDLAARTN